MGGKEEGSVTPRDFNRVVLLLRTILDHTPDPQISSVYRGAERGTKANTWIDCRAGCADGLIRRRQHVLLCPRCAGRGLEHVDAYLAEWMEGSSHDHVDFVNRLDERERNNRELRRLQANERVRMGLEAHTSPVEAFAASRAPQPYPRLWRALERLPHVQAHVIFRHDVYQVVERLSTQAQAVRDLGVNTLVLLLGVPVVLPRHLVVNDGTPTIAMMVEEGWKASRIARTLGVSEAKAKRLARRERREASRGM